MGTVLGCQAENSGATPGPLAADAPEGNPRNKTALKPGRSLMDWVKLGHSGTDLAGTGGRILDITPQDLAKHNKQNDCWMALRGKVYNVTSYMEFHPGGEQELMRGVGTDATDLFNEIHKWVNFETMLQKCLVGRLVESRPFFLKPNFLPLLKGIKGSIKSDAAQNPLPNKNLLSASTLEPPMTRNAISPLVSPLTPSTLPNPKFDWFQTNTLINIAIYTKWKHITKDHVVVIKKEKVMKVVCYIQDMVYTVHIDLHKHVAEDFELKTGSNSGKVDILLNKMEPGVRWSVVGKTLEGHGIHVKSKDREIEYVTCSLAAKESITQDSRLFVIQVPKYTYLPVPIGYHVYIRLPGKDTVKPYTPVAASLSTADPDESGRQIHLFIKIYDEGAFTPALDELALGSEIEVSLPEGTFTHDKLTTATTTATDVALLGAGTGITPMIRVMLEAIKNEKKVHLILFNKTEEDIPWKEELDNLMEDHSSLLKVTHVLSKANDSWSGLQGHIRQELLEKLLPVGNHEQTIYLCICGPSEFTKLGINLFKELGYSSDSFHAFLG
ncbi:cytochrome b5 reductase 4 isoform X2 [Procambarus clarkii]|uniref:cytochrome b5 reductase 4 isoform X2 n=1 Tax=Procambarus clarkii TaxID=6728 RepID=UPI001E673827|nr:cytochrome b5 reductase 4-like isoform X1 [Procambarus clarkii]XP_045617342.1 cytochrome b5 reductase 4-like isoform X1 [Procambarus clarkii]XP_045617343.1 cytochrome b5 reductase 4-like isoform X1 [Procambarus clarkii]XP_045617344.1 cytochrome b5 reductase 4-like isoform X1 [Procambarus clarkii]XP_045617345.1 cytochrome b5 reductase 4-like isoform X1 [Procambarus clarkii]